MIGPSGRTAPTGQPARASDGPSGSARRPWWRVDWRAPPRGLIIGAGVIALVVILVLAAFGPLVRVRVAREADRRKLDVDVAHVRPGFFAIVAKTGASTNNAEPSATSMWVRSPAAVPYFSRL